MPPPGATSAFALGSPPFGDFFNRRVSLTPSTVAEHTILSFEQRALLGSPLHWRSSPEQLLDPKRVPKFPPLQLQAKDVSPPLVDIGVRPHTQSLTHLLVCAQAATTVGPD